MAGERIMVGHEETAGKETGHLSVKPVPLHVVDMERDKTRKEVCCHSVWAQYAPLSCKG